MTFVNIFTYQKLNMLARVTELIRHMERDDNFRDLDREAAEVIREMTNARFLVEEGKERVNVCLAEEQMIEEGREEGREEGMAALIRFSQKNGITYEKTWDEICMSLDKTREDAKVFLDRYWK